MLRSVGSVQTVGTETVDGVSTTHYKATIDLAKAAGTVGGPAQDAVQHLIDQGGPSSIPVDVWIGDDGLVRKLTVDETVSNGGQTGTAHLTLDLSDYGTAVNVTAPPSATRSTRPAWSRWQRRTCRRAPPLSAASLVRRF